MTLITLDDAKRQARIDSEDDSEDVLLQGYVDAAIASVANDLGFEVDEMDEEAPAPVKSAALLIFCGLYENRGAIGTQPFSRNPTVNQLLAPYRKYR